jgi:hypothetical protein
MGKLAIQMINGKVEVGVSRDEKLYIIDRT